MIHSQLLYWKHFWLKVLHMCSYVSFVCNIHMWDISDVDHVRSLFNTDLSYILSIVLEIVKCSNKYIFWSLYMCCFYFTHMDCKNVFLWSLFRFSKPFYHRHWIMWYLLYTTLWMYNYEIQHKQQQGKDL